MNLQTIKTKISDVFRVPTDRNIMWGEIKMFLENPANRITDKQKESAVKFFQTLCKKQDQEKLKEEKAREKAREKAFITQKKQAEKLRKLREENPYYLNEDGIERTVDILVYTSTRKYGRFSGRASIIMPSALQWAEFCSKNYKTRIQVRDIANRTSTKFEKEIFVN